MIAALARRVLTPELLGPLVRRLLAAPPWLLARVAALEPAARGMDPQAHAVLVLRNRVLRSHALRADDPASVASARREMAFAARLMAPASPRGVAVDDRVLATATGARAIRLYRPARLAVSDARGAPGLVYFHGGGFALGDLDTHDAVCRALADLGACVVLSVAYRLAPEHPFPAAPDDAIAAFGAVLRDAAALGLDPARVAVGGDSAGGNLAALVALAARADARRPALQVLVYPHTDLTRTAPSIARFATGFFLERPMLDAFADAYAPDASMHRDPRASPAFADVTETAPAIVVTAGFDPLVDEGRMYAERLAAAGVPTTHLHYATLFHGFASTAGGIAAAAAALRDVGTAVRAALARPAS